MVIYNKKMIRVGRVRYESKGKASIPIFPSYPNFESIVVLMKSHSKWGDLGPYDLINEDNELFENYYQFYKCYEYVPATTQYYSRYDKTVTWNHPNEVHFSIKNNKPTKEYWNWRNKGLKNKYYVRYPVGYYHRHKCLFSLIKRDNISEDDKKNPKFIDCDEMGFYEKLDYIEARKELYMKEYCRLVKKEPKFVELQEKLLRGENLLILEVDGPVQESLDYYKSNYNVDDNFIENHTMLINEKNFNIMLNDPKHPAGHCYMLAVALLNKEDEWNKKLFDDYKKIQNNTVNNAVNNVVNNVDKKNNGNVKIIVNKSDIKKIVDIEENKNVDKIDKIKENIKKTDLEYEKIMKLNSKMKKKKIKIID